MRSLFVFLFVFAIGPPSWLGKRGYSQGIANSFRGELPAEELPARELQRPDFDWVEVQEPLPLVRTTPLEVSRKDAALLRVEELAPSPALTYFETAPTDQQDLDWLQNVRVGYDDGIVIASQQNLDLGASEFPYRLKINGWGQLRHTQAQRDSPATDLNQFQLKRGRIIFSGNAFSSDFSYYVQLDGRSSSGDDVRLLDYYLNYDVGHDQFGWNNGTLVFRAGKYKVPFTLARWMSGREFEFTDRSMASIFFDVNRSFAWGVAGKTPSATLPIQWEVAVFNGLVTGGAETGSSGTLDDNFAYSGRFYTFPCGDWGNSQLADFQIHDQLATRIGFGFASSKIERFGTTEFSRLRVVNSGSTLSSLLPIDVDAYDVHLFSIDGSMKYAGWSSTFEHYFRNVSRIQGSAVPDLFDHGFWFQVGKFILPKKLECVARWSRIEGNSGTLGTQQQHSEEIGGALAWYWRENHAKFVLDTVYLKSPSISSASLDITPQNREWLFRTQVQFSF